MTMQLFILGPAFGLPSIDAECNAAVALLQLYLKDRFKLIPTHDQTHRLPHLADGNTRISGFTNIVRYLREVHGLGQDVGIDGTKGADAFAAAAFIEAHAPILLDISLYVSFENYRTSTRPAFTKILPWYANYIIPPRRRAAARTRTEHLGISSIDVDNVHEDMSNRPPGFEAVGRDPGFEPETQKRASLLLPRKETLRSLLQRPEHAAIFKLHALADNFFDPLQDMLGGKEFVGGTPEPSSIDCLLYGYLALMLLPEVPQDWLASTLRRKYKGLVAYTMRLHGLLELPVDVDQVIGLVSHKSQSDNVQQSSRLSLPYTAPAPETFPRALMAVGLGICDQIPLLGISERLHLLDISNFSFLDRHLQLLLCAAVASVASSVYLTIRAGYLVWPHGQDIHLFGRKRLSDYGHLGAALSGISLPRETYP